MRMPAWRMLLGVGLAGVVVACCWVSVAAAGVGLPDGRAYELVSPLGNGEVFQPPNAVNNQGTALIGEGQFRAAADGEGMVYVGDAPGSGIGGNGNQFSATSYDNEYLASRATGGWGASDIEPPPASELETLPIYQSFSSDLSAGYLASPDKPTLAGAPVCRGSWSDLYSRSSVGGGFAALFTSTLTPGECGKPLFAGVSADGSRVLFQTEAALVAPAVPTAGSGDVTVFCNFDCNLYESVGSTVSLVNLLPGGGVDTAATFGGPSGNGGAEKNLPDLSDAISADGSRVVWSDVSTGVIYVRVGGVSTVQVSAGAARFWTASVDGRFVFYTEGERLLRFDVESGVREELAGAGVQGVVGTSEDGSYVYFVANGVLAAGAAPGSCKEEAYTPSPPSEAEKEARCNLYALHVGEPVRFIATLAGSDNNLYELGGASSNRSGQFGDWQSDLGSRTAEVTPSGLGVSFSSTLPLTGYDNVAPSEPEHRAIPELFVYQWEGGGGRLDCASCAPSGVPPTDDLARSQETTAEYRLGGWVHPSTWGTYMQRWLSADGSRVFFDTAQPLVARDTNRLTDVYEWESAGVGGCGQPGGCVYLLSGGSSQNDSFFLDASVSGDDVFFMTRAQLVPEDRDESFHLYDARAPHVPGEAVGFPPVPGAVCGGADCQGSPPAVPGFGVPASVSFSGVGNLPPPAPVAAPKSKPKRVVVCRRGFTRRRGRCVRAKARPRAGHAKAKGRR
jgi:hypothetical protein